MFSISGILIAFGSGIFGAAIGAQPAFIIVGFLVLGGVFIQTVTGSGDFLSTVAFGAWGPHVGGFAAGVAATAYAAKRGKLDSGRDVAAGMVGMNSPDVLLVGGIFGVLGFILNYLFALPGAWTDSVALTVVASAIIARLLFSNTGVLGKVAQGEQRYLPTADHSWLPWQSKPLQLLVLGLGAGLFSAYMALIVPNGAGVTLCFGLAAASLVFLQFGTRIPVTHHIVLPAAVAASASGSIVWGAIFGILSAFVGEFMANTFNIWGDTHIDPPAATIAPMTTLSILLTSLGVFSIISLP